MTSPGYLFIHFVSFIWFIVRFKLVIATQSNKKLSCSQEALSNSKTTYIFNLDHSLLHAFPNEVNMTPRTK